MKTISICDTEQRAAEHLIECWGRIPRGGVYPGIGSPPFSTLDIDSLDAFLLKVRFCDTNGDKYGAIVAISTVDSSIDPQRVADRVAAHFQFPQSLEYRTTTHHTTKWTPISIPIPITDKD